MLADMSLALSNLKNIYNYRGRTISLTPDDLFSSYTKFISLLPLIALTWSFSLVILIFHTFSLKFQDVVQLGGYILSNLSN